MTLTTRLSRSLNLVKAFEAFHAGAVPQSDGGFVIGYGHTASAREGAVVTRAEAEDLLLYDLGEIGKLLDAWVYAPMQDNQRQALIAFGFNVGADNLHRSTALRRLNAGDYMGCAREIERWRVAELAGRGQVVDALVRRRAAEKALFLTPVNGFLKTESSRLRPRFDGERTTAATQAAPPIETGSAAVAAAHAVSARLRALLPDPEPDGPMPTSTPELDTAEPDQPELDLAPAVPPLVDTLVQPTAADDVPDRDLAARQPADTPAESIAIDPDLSESDLSQSSLFARNPLEAAPSVTAQDVALDHPFDAQPPWPLDETAPPPPPFVAAARRPAPTLVSANDVDHASLGGSDSDTLSLHRGAGPAAPSLDAKPTVVTKAQALREGVSSRAAAFLKRGHIFLGLFGVLLFVLSILFILTGAPTMINLVIGLLGVLCMTPAAYHLMGPRRSQ
jgi:lysozyme